MCTVAYMFECVYAYINIMEIHIAEVISVAELII